jgi:Arc/MetJ family transcription regulator
MARARISTTVDSDLLAEARRLLGSETDAELIDQALRALLRTRRQAEIDDSYRAYDRQPLSEPDAWGDLASFRETAGGS